MPEQFILPLVTPRAADGGSFIVAPCNDQAVEFVRRWPDWPAHAAALFGPAACGKTQLAAMWRSRAGAAVISARDLGAGTAIAGLTAVVVEDMDRAPPDASRDHVLIELFDHPESWLLFTGRTGPSQWPAATGDWHSRLQSLIAFEIWAPDDDFLSVLMERHFAERQLNVPASLVNRILNHVERTPDAVARFIESADRRALAEKRPVSLRLVTEMLDSRDRVEASVAQPVGASTGLAP